MSEAYFVDTSGLGRRYLSEIGALWVRSWVEPAAENVIIIADTAPLELFCAFARLVREGRLNPERRDALKVDCLIHIEREYLTVPINVEVLGIARTVAEKHPLRAMDALQLACALHAQQTLETPLIFVTGDNVLLRAAQAEGFTVQNPYNYA